MRRQYFRPINSYYVRPFQVTRAGVAPPPSPFYFTRLNRVRRKIGALMHRCPVTPHRTMKLKSLSKTQSLFGDTYSIKAHLKIHQLLVFSYKDLAKCRYSFNTV